MSGSQPVRASRQVVARARRREHPVEIVFHRARQGLFGLAALGVATVVTGLATAKLSPLLAAFGIVTSFLAGTVGVIVEILEKSLFSE